MMHTLNTPPRQVLLRLPEDLAAKLARAVAPRQRNRFLVNMLRQRLDEEDPELVAACEYMNALEAANPDLARESQEWVDAALTDPVDVWDPDFDRETFEREVAEAQARMRAKQAKPKGGR